MEYFVSMNRKELQASLLLKEEVPPVDVLSLEEGIDDLENSPQVFREMYRKGFLKEEEGHPVLTPFADSVLEIVLFPESVLEQTWNGKGTCSFFFRGSCAVMMNKEEDQEQYVFYFVPVVPKMVGGMASFYDELQSAMTEIGEDIHPEESVHAGCENAAALSELVKTDFGMERESPEITIRAYGEEVPSYSALLFQNHGRFYLAEGTEEKTVISETDYYRFIQSISGEIIYLHGLSMRRDSTQDE